MSHNHLEERRLSRSVRTDDTDDAIRRKHEVQIIKEQFVAKGFGHMLRLDDFVSESRSVRNKDFQLSLAFLLVLIEQFLVGVESGFSLRLSGLGCHINPFQLALQRLAAFACLLLFLRHPFGFLVEPRRVVAFPRDTFAPVEFENPACHMVEEVAVVGNADDCPGILLQMLFEPIDRFRIEVVRRLVEQQDIRLLEQEAAESHAAPFATRKRIDYLVFRRTTQGIHRPFQFAIDIPGICRVDFILQFRLAVDEGVHLVGVFQNLGVAKAFVHLFIFAKDIHDFLDTFLDYLLHGLARLQFRVLLQIAHRVTRREDYFALIFFVDTGDNLEQRRFTRPVETDNANLCPVEERKVDIFQYLFLRREYLAHADHREDYFLVVCHKILNG